MLRATRIALGFALFAGLFGAAPASTAMAAPPRLQEGSPFPDITLPALDDGRPLSIAHFRGKKVVLHVFASW